MTFEEWLGDRIETMSSHEYAAEKAAWEVAFAEGYRHAILDELVAIAEKCKVE